MKLPLYSSVYNRFAVIVATDCACWLPIIVVKLAALGGKYQSFSKLLYQINSYAGIYRFSIGKKDDNDNDTEML